MKKFVKQAGFMIVCTALWTAMCYVACKIYDWIDNYRTNKEIEKLNYDKAVVEATYIS